MLATLVILAFPYTVAGLYSRYSNNFWEGNWGYYYTLTHSIETPALVLVKPYESFRTLYFAEPPEEKDPIIFALQQDEKMNQMLMEYYLTRHVYIIDGWELKKLR